MDLLGGIGAGGSVLGGLMTAFGQYQTGKDTRLVQDLNAAVSRANAQAIKTSGEFDVRSMEKAKKRFTQSQHAGYAKAGVRSEGSALDVMIDSAAEAQIDILVSKYNSTVGQIQSNLEARQAEISGKLAERKGKYAAGKTLLSTAANFAMLL